MKGLMHRARGPCAVATLFLCVAPGRAGASEPWIAPGNVQVRHDVQLLADAGVIDLPVSYWPIAASDLAHALESADDRNGRPALTAAQQAALSRLRPLAREGRTTVEVQVAGAARPVLIRGYAATPREEGEVAASVAGFFGERFGGRLELTAVADPDDDESLRLDGSYVAGRFGNWIATFGAQDRWWGPGWEGSLILSTNARPVPAIALDRAVSTPFESKWLRWIGPWRLTTFMGRMEDDRNDYDRPLLWGMRISARPLDGLELSVDRTAQWCGEGRSCNWDDFWNLFTGNDNAGENVDAEDEPGNQLASYEIRWASPIGSAPYLLYFQHTGETIDNNIPRPYRTLDLVGAEVWGGSGSGGASWRAGLEWAQTRCGGTENGLKLWDCAYENGIFTDGYRYHGRVMGHSMDGDGEMLSARFVRVGTASDTLTGVLRYAELNQGGRVPDTTNSVARGPEDMLSLDVTYRRPLGRGWIEGSAGVERRDRDWNGVTNLLPRVALTWSHAVR